VLVAVVCQRLVYRSDLKIQVPECEVLMPSHSVKSHIRRGDFFKMISSMETGANEGMWTYQRYRTWLEARKTWHIPGEKIEEEPAGDAPEIEELQMSRPALPKMAESPAATPKTSTPATPSPRTRDERLEIEPEEGGLDAIITKLKNKP
jgi:twitching motility protein PilT